MRKEIPIPDDLQKEQDRQISQAVEREGSRLRNFIRRRIAIPADAEDILQDAFYRLVETVRFAQPVERIGPWLYRTARNRIVDVYRRERQAVSTGSPLGGEDDDSGASHRMDGRSWSRMTPDQRANAREAWRAWSRMSREERQAFWAEVCARAAARSASQPGAGPGTGSPA